MELIHDLYAIEAEIRGTDPAARLATLIPTLGFLQRSAPSCKATSRARSTNCSRGTTPSRCDRDSAYTTPNPPPIEFDVRCNQLVFKLQDRIQTSNCKTDCFRNL